jgi:hypothetical protein
MIVTRRIPHNICPGCYFLDNGDSYSRLPNDVDQVVELLFRILVLVLLLMLLMLVDYFIGCVVRLAFALQLKIIYERTLIGIYMSIVLHLCYFSMVDFRKVQDCVLEKKEFEDPEGLRDEP